jgi:peroxiredoxin
MKASWNVWMVTLLLVGAIAWVSFLGGQPQPGEPVVEAAAPVKAVSQPTVTPDLTKVDPTQFLAPIPVGRKAPDFQAIDAMTGKPLRLSDFKGKKNVVLVFYQGSFCPVCGKQLEDLQSNLKQFQGQDTEIMAISADPQQQAQQTLGEHGLSFRVLPDPSKAIIQKFGVANITKGGIAWPSAFIVDKAGVVRLSVAEPDGRRLKSQDLLPVLSKVTGKPVR